MLNCVNCVMLLWTCYNKCLVIRITWMCVRIFTFWVHRRNRRALCCPTTTTFTSQGSGTTKSAARAATASCVRNFRVRCFCFFIYSYFIKFLNYIYFCWARLGIPCPLVVIDTSKSPTHSYHHPLPTKIEYRGHNYRVLSGNLSWYNAMVTCRENHSDLASIMDAYHQAFLTVLVNRLGAPHWIGLHSEMAVGVRHKKKGLICLACSQLAIAMVTVCYYWLSSPLVPSPLPCSSRVVSVISGLTAVKPCTPTGTPRMMRRRTPWRKTASTWTWMADGGGQTVRRCCQAPSVRNHSLVSSSRVRLWCRWHLVVLLACDNALLLCLPGSNHFTSSEVECPSTWVKFGQSCYSFDPVVYQLTFEKSREHCRRTGKQPGLYK